LAGTTTAATQRVNLPPEETDTTEHHGSQNCPSVFSSFPAPFPTPFLLPYLPTYLPTYTHKGKTPISPPPIQPRKYTPNKSFLPPPSQTHSPHNDTADQQIQEKKKEKKGKKETVKIGKVMF